MLSGDALVGFTSAEYAGLPTFGAPGTDFPTATSGYIVPDGGTAGSGEDNGTTMGYYPAANTVYWFAPGTHYFPSGQMLAGTGAVLVGGPGAVVNGGGINGTAGGVIVEYLTVQDLSGTTSGSGQGFVNNSLEPNWTIEHDTIEDGSNAGVNVGSNDTVEYDCIYNNGEAGVVGYGGYDDTISYNEVSGNDPSQVDYPGSPVQCGCGGGIKMLESTDVTISGNYVHGNGDPGLWLDTDNAGTTITDNYISDNYSEGIFYETSYDGLIENNTLVDNSWGGGGVGGTTYGNVTGAIYVSESGSPPAGYTVTPWCAMTGACPPDTQVTCAGSTACQSTFVITQNTFVNNWGGVIIYEDSGRNSAYCPSGSPSPGDCPSSDPSALSDSLLNGHGGTLVGPASSIVSSGDPWGAIACYNAQDAGPGGSPDYADLCQWLASNVSVTDNVFSINPATINANLASGEPQCTVADKCGFAGLFAFDAGGTYQPSGCPGGGNAAYQCEDSASVNISYDQGNVLSDNEYYGPWQFWDFSQSNLANPVSWSTWARGGKRGGASRVRCSDRNIGRCAVPFGQDRGSSLLPNGGPWWGFGSGA